MEKALTQGKTENRKEHHKVNVEKEKNTNNPAVLVWNLSCQFELMDFEKHTYSSK